MAGKRGSWLRGLALGVGLVWMALAGACESNSDADPTRRGCVELRDHLLDLRGQNVTADVEQHRAALKASLGPGFVDRCVQDVDAAKLQCLLGARDAAELAACEQ